MQLSSDIECQQVLVNTKRLKEDPSLARISIAKWLSRAEVDKVKHLRKQCCDLNKDCPPDVSGRKLYMVISGRLMKRVEDGKLQRIPPTTPTNTSIAFPLSSAGSQKKEEGGSQVAPIGSPKIALLTVMNGTQLAL